MTKQRRSSLGWENNRRAQGPHVRKKMRDSADCKVQGCWTMGYIYMNERIVFPFYYYFFSFKYYIYTYQSIFLIFYYYFNKSGSSRKTKSKNCILQIKPNKICASACMHHSLGNILSIKKLFN
jgi:hypothetical protein